MYQPLPRVPAKKLFPYIEERILRFWDETHAFEKLAQRLAGSDKRFSFVDGPITANNPMGVHHAWGRTYKDIFQRYKAMTGHNQRWQNGFDCQGLWVEVEVEKELGFKSKRDIEDYGIAAFVQRCKERVLKFARIQTEQSIRLGYWMDWDNSYFTMSDANNYTIWHMLKTCHERGWLYRGHDVMPWCPRCGTGISQHEIDTEGYHEVTHTSLYVKLPLDGRDGESLLVWTTTPWTLTSNVAAAVHPDLSYAKATRNGESVWLAEARVGVLGRGWEVERRLRGEELLGWTYRGPFDELPAQREASYTHRVIPWTEVSQEEGTGIVHIAPGCGQEDYQLGKELGLPAIAPIDDSGIYLRGFDWLTGKPVGEVAQPIADDLRQKGVLLRAEPYLHRYPHCWRCRSELVFRLVDEWYISMDELRPMLMDVTRQIRWLPEFGLDRELDWLKNMHDWMISKKRYWGLALPFWLCDSCDHLDVVGSREELASRATAGWDTFDGHSPHRPWVDEVKLTCPKCNGTMSRIPDVGNPWLDAGIVAYSTLGYDADHAHWEQWFPAEFITESFPGQYRNWFYAMLVMSTVLENRPPFKTVLGFGTLYGEDGRPMHKSAGNSVEFNEAAEKVGADPMRWTYATGDPKSNLLFGYNVVEGNGRNLVTLWNSYAFFITYASIEQWRPNGQEVPAAERPEMDRWILARTQRLIATVRERLDDFDPMGASRAIEASFEDLSNWYIRRSRARFWAPGGHADPAALATLHEVLVTQAKLIAPFTPFLAEEIYQNLVRSVVPEAPESIHHTTFPEVDPALQDERLVSAMEQARLVVSLGHSLRKQEGIGVRRPLPRVRVSLPSGSEPLTEGMLAQVADELNVKAVDVTADLTEAVRHHVETNPRLLGPKYGKEYPAIRQALQAGQFIVRDDGRVEAAGRVLEPEEVTVSLKPVEGFAAAVEHGVLVVLDTTQTPELLSEGRAREWIRLIQDARKTAGFEVADRITVAYVAPDDLARVLVDHADYVKRETLALALGRREALGPEDGAATEGEIDDMPVSLAVKRSQS